MFKYKENEFVECINVTEVNHEGLVVGELYKVVGVDILDGNELYIVLDKNSRIRHSIDRFKPVDMMQKSPNTIEISAPISGGTVKYDNVDKPVHYNQYRVEVIEIIEDATKGLDGITAFCIGNVLKYVLRFKFKNGIEDLKKARFYLDKVITKLDDGE